MSDTHFSRVLRDGESPSEFLTSDSLIAIRNSTNRTLELGCPTVRVEPRKIAVVCKDNGYVENALAKRLVSIVAQGSSQDKTPTSRRGRKSSAQVVEPENETEEPSYGGGFFQTVALNEPAPSVQLDSLDGEQQPDE